ncbi:hypothetical protein I546_1002 [Mycobacterium kansasii 732]|uniref:DUF1501 domain-containing protein n=1 Tax=Mycobacterium pseudokansasii TaxID=2341080 RepID=A0A498QHS2_9MYCO|nr:DUF1501 domain-containing protein [Mycobacterium pseudokansasii]EUA15351.1 hypothetical protein I546_1002 [Mycobacterium kansasii 732]MBY0387010.1 DUF1501 domain-containing protein [Mycobacterium pseudokansasii]VAZ88874.1 hypothetical protein LAUMK35_00699 [Mycobacterium pseudokansasii]VAZ89377.1 hypothetical protein LAUMK21_00697 [Mycobacterium pseudokansasii]VBA47014.1 hypothetical protein LAUMK142_00575 [Mycobacterium pseudokansasii]
MINRRRFLIASAGVGAAGLLSGAVAVSWRDLQHAAYDRPLADDAGVLVIVTLYGGNDGINTVIPYADNAYHDARPELAYTAGDVLQLDAQLGLNPALRGLAQLWQQRQLAIVRGAGYPKPDHSHFRSMDIWQTASPAEAVSTGWIGRWLDATGDDPLRAVNIGAVLPPLAVGEKHTAAALSVTVAPQAADRFDATMQALSAPDPNDTPAMAAVSRAYRDARTTDAAFASLKPESGHNSLATQLSMVAAAITARVPTRVYTVQLGGFDTHADERDTQQRLLQTFDEAVAGFLREMAGDRCGRNVVVLAYSEFGRRVAANASQGTDHGTAGPVFVAGVPVNGGYYGDEPSLTDLDHGDLKATKDFRDIYHELLVHTLASDPAPSVGTGRTSLGFL